MRKRIALAVEPHVYEIDRGNEIVELNFQPEVIGTEFVEAQQKLAADRENAQEITDRVKQAEAANTALREYLSGFMLPDSADLFAELPLPDWVLNDMTMWVIEVYTRRPPTSPSDSADGPPTSGKPSTGAGRSKASTRTPGRRRG